jgi:hypothetical protein
MPGRDLTAEIEDCLRHAAAAQVGSGPLWTRLARAFEALSALAGVTPPSTMDSPAWAQLDRAMNGVFASVDWSGVGPEADATPAIEAALRGRSVNELEALSVEVVESIVDLLRIHAARRALATGFLPP